MGFGVNRWGFRVHRFGGDWGCPRGAGAQQHPSGVQAAPVEWQDALCGNAGMAWGELGVKGGVWGCIMEFWGRWRWFRLHRWFWRGPRCAGVQQHPRRGADRTRATTGCSAWGCRHGMGSIWDQKWILGCIEGFGVHRDVPGVHTGAGTPRGAGTRQHPAPAQPSAAPSTLEGE